MAKQDCRLSFGMSQKYRSSGKVDPRARLISDVVHVGFMILEHKGLLLQVWWSGSSMGADTIFNCGTFWLIGL